MISVSSLSKNVIFKGGNKKKKSSKLKGQPNRGLTYNVFDNLTIRICACLLKDSICMLIEKDTVKSRNQWWWWRVCFFFNSVYSGPQAGFHAVPKRKTTMLLLKNFLWQNQRNKFVQQGKQREKQQPYSHSQFVGNKAKGRISKQVLQENKACQIFPKTNIFFPWYAHYQGVRNVRFWENLACFVFL